MACVSKAEREGKKMKPDPFFYPSFIRIHSSFKSSSSSRVKQREFVHKDDVEQQLGAPAKHFRERKVVLDRLQEIMEGGPAIIEDKQVEIFELKAKFVRLQQKAPKFLDE